MFSPRLSPIAVLVALALGFPLAEVKANPPARPNIIFILADDLAQGDLGCYGQKHIQTPRLDQMAAEGTRFTQAYCGTSVCAPSRTSLMTGLHMGHSPIRGNREIAKGAGQTPLPAGTVTVAQILQSTGYATACMGKWGMGMFDTSGSPLKKGFDHFYGYNCQRHAHDYFPTHLFNDDKRVENDGKTYAQDLIQQEVLSWVRAHKDQPFFLFYAVTLPHGKYEIDDLGIYEEKPWSPEERTYAAMVTRLDRDVGQLLDLLKELGLDTNTLVLFAGDNGSSFDPGSALGKRFGQSAVNGLRGFKRHLYEGALRQAALARWPGVIPAGRVTDEPWAFWDFLPTAAELSGVKLAKDFQCDGVSLVTFLRGGKAPTREYFYWELFEGPFRQAIRFGDWKAVRNEAGAPLELYNLGSDPGEGRDLASANPEMVEKAENLIKAARVEDPQWPVVVKSHRKSPAAEAPH